MYWPAISALMDKEKFIPDPPYPMDQDGPDDGTNPDPNPGGDDETFTLDESKLDAAELG